MQIIETDMHRCQEFHPQWAHSILLYLNVHSRNEQNCTVTKIYQHITPTKRAKENFDESMKHQI